MNIRCEGCDATPTSTEQKLCKYCGFEFDYSKLEIAEETVVEIDETATEVKEEKTEVATTIEEEKKVISARENSEAKPVEPEKGVFKKLFGKK